MLIVLRPDTLSGEIDAVVAAVHTAGYRAQILPGQGRTAVAVLGNDIRIDAGRFDGLPGVERILHVSDGYRLAARHSQPARTAVRLGSGLTIGEGHLVVAAGPCAVESEAQLLTAARAVADAGAVLLRGGAYKPRSSPYSFQGLGAPGLALLAKARRETGLAIVTEAIDSDTVDEVAEVADIIQIGARNMQNYTLLRRAAHAGKPVLLKRGLAATLEDLLLSAEYLLAEGQGDVLLCERGIRGFDPASRNLFDVGAIPLLQRMSHLPVLADPSHGIGHRDLVPAMARAAVAAGADGVMIEVHPHPAEARSDGLQSIEPAVFHTLMADLRAIAAVVGRSAPVSSEAGA